MDQTIINIEMKWAEQVCLGNISRTESREKSRNEVVEYLIGIGAIEIAVAWKWKLAEASKLN